MPKAPIRQVFRYWKPTGVLSTTLPCKDGQNILQHSPPLARYLAEATANRVVVPIGRLVSARTMSLWLLLCECLSAHMCCIYFRIKHLMDCSCWPLTHHCVHSFFVLDSEDHVARKNTMSRPLIACLTRLSSAIGQEFRFEIEINPLLPCHVW